MDQNNDWEGLCAFIRASRYDLLQPCSENQWGPAWTFAGTDVHAAEKAGWQLKRMGVSRFRHACRAQIHDGSGIGQTVVIVTEVPGRTQTVLDMQTALPIVVERRYTDEALRALESASGLGARSSEELTRPCSVKAHPG